MTFQKRNDSISKYLSRQERDYFADVAELADAPDLGSGGRPCGFESLHPHFLFLRTKVLKMLENAVFSVLSGIFAFRFYPIACITLAE